MRGHADNDRRRKKSSTFAVKNHSEIPVSMLLLTILLWGRKKTGMKNCTPHVQKITMMMKYNKVHK